jgi:carboxyl-terminal processing protease
MSPFLPSPERAILFLLLAGAALSACAAPESTVAEPVPSTISPAAAAYLEEVATLLQRHSVRRRSIDWTAFRAEMIAAAGPAQSIDATHPGVRRALELLGDGHSVYVPMRGTPISVPTRRCDAPTVGRVLIPPGIGYLRVRSFSGTPAAATLYAQQLQDSIRAADRDGLLGWIVDLRGNSGGNMYPMLAGVGAILGEGVHGYFVDADGVEVPFSYRAGVSFYDNVPLHELSSVYRLRQPPARIAVLTDGWVASSGEAMAVAFRGRAQTRSFGTPTCGLSTGTSTWFLSDTSRLIITSAIMVDRTRRAYGDVIVPDETIADPNEVVTRAIQWLLLSSVHP